MVKLSTLNADAGLRDDLSRQVIFNNQGTALTPNERHHLQNLNDKYRTQDPHIHDPDVHKDTLQSINYAGRQHGIDMTSHLKNLEASFKAAYQRFFWTFQQFGLAHPQITPNHGMRDWQSLFKTRIEHPQDILKYSTWLLLIAIDQLWRNNGLTQGQGFNHAHNIIGTIVGGNAGGFIGFYDPPNHSYSAVHNNLLYLLSGYTLNPTFPN